MMIIVTDEKRITEVLNKSLLSKYFVHTGLIQSVAKEITEGIKDSRINKDGIEATVIIKS